MHPKHEEVLGKKPKDVAKPRRRRSAAPPLDAREAFRRATYDFAALHSPSVDSESPDTLRDEIVAAVDSIVAGRLGNK